MATYKNIAEFNKKRKFKIETWIETLQRGKRNRQQRLSREKKLEYKEKINMIPYSGSVFLKT